MEESSDTKPDTQSVTAALTQADKSLLIFFEQNWYLHGRLPTRELCVKAGYGGVVYDRAIKKQGFKESLTRRGITVEEGHVLTAEQLTAANVMLDLTDSRSRRKKLTELNISTSKWEGWLRDPNFQSYLRQRAENLLGDNLHESHLALLERVRSGDIGAIKYFNEITGRYVPASNEKVDVNGVLMKVLEIIQRHVSDPEALSNIAADFLLLADTSGSRGAPLVQQRMPGVSKPITLDMAPVGALSLGSETEPNNFVFGEI